MRVHWRFWSRIRPAHLCGAHLKLGARKLWMILVAMTSALSIYAMPAQAEYRMPPQARALRTYVSGSGTDNDSCTIRKPCRTFQAALAQTVAGGEIYALDS